MAENVPQFFTGSGTTTFTPVGNPRALLVENLDTTNSIRVTYNGSSGNWLMAPGTRKGNWIKGGVTTVTITAVAGSPTWQAELTL